MPTTLKQIGAELGRDAGNVKYHAMKRGMRILNVRGDSGHMMGAVANGDARKLLKEFKNVPKNSRKAIITMNVPQGCVSIIDMAEMLDRPYASVLSACRTLKINVGGKGDGQYISDDKKVIAALEKWDKEARRCGKWRLPKTVREEHDRKEKLEAELARTRELNEMGIEEWRGMSKHDLILLCRFHQLESDLDKPFSECNRDELLDELKHHLYDDDDIEDVDDEEDDETYFEFVFENTKFGELCKVLEISPKQQIQKLMGDWVDEKMKVLRGVMDK